MMSLTTTPRERGEQSDSGVAMILVMVWCAILLIMSLVVSQAVINQIRPSDRNELSFDAWAAAEAGIDDFRARLAVNPDYYKTVDAANKAYSTTTWAALPGSTQYAAEFQYQVLDQTSGANSGRITVVSTGRALSKVNPSGEYSTRKVQAVLYKRSPYEYAYVSNFETIPYDYPDAYVTPANPSQYVKNGDLTTAGAQYLCSERYWYQLPAGQPPVVPGETVPVRPWHRNSLRCKYTTIDSDQRWYGDIHTNDAWYFNTASTSTGTFAQVFDGNVTSACPEGTTSATCPKDHLWIDASTLNPGNLPYQQWEIAAGATTPGNLKNPSFDASLDMPDTRLAKIKAQAVSMSPASWGCFYTGVTRISFFNTKILVTSPDTRDTNPMCAGALETNGARTGLMSTVGAPYNQPTAILDYPTMAAKGFNGVFYVADGYTANPYAPTDVLYTATQNNLFSLWPQNTPPSCLAKTGTGSKANLFPFVIPKNAQSVLASPYSAYPETYLFSSATYNGLPVETTLASNATKTDWWSDPASVKCGLGTLYAQGQYSGRLTLATESDTVITDDLMDVNVVNKSTPDPAAGQPLYGVPASTSTNVLGLVPKRYLYVYHPQNNEGSNGWNDTYLRDIILNFATVVLDKCFSVQQFNQVPAMKTLTLVGSLYQRYRCHVKTDGSTNTGYSNFTVRYDQRFKTLPAPPFVMELSVEPWAVVSLSELSAR